MHAALGNRNVYEMIHGIFVGHIYYYLVAVVPTITGKHALTTPRVLIDLIEGPAGEGDEDGEDEDDEALDIDDLVNDDVRQQVNVNRAQLLRRFQQIDGATPAHVAAKMNDLRSLQALATNIDTKTYFIQRDNNGWQPLHEAVRGGYIDIIDYLLSVDLTSSTSSTPTTDNEDEVNTNDDDNNDHDGNDANSSDIVVRRVDINARTNYRQRNDNLGCSPLYLAETIHGVQHPVSVRLRELGAIRFAPGETTITTTTTTS